MSSFVMENLNVITIEFGAYNATGLAGVPMWDSDISIKLENWLLFNRLDNEKDSN